MLWRCLVAASSSEGVSRQYGGVESRGSWESGSCIEGML